MRRLALVVGLTFVGGITLGVIGDHLLHAQQSPIKRTEVLRTEMLGMDGKEAHMWIADIAPGAATGTHRHPTPRFVYVMGGVGRSGDGGAASADLQGRPGFHGECRRST
jgi:hypothetical protein